MNKLVSPYVDEEVGDSIKRVQIDGGTGPF